MKAHKWTKLKHMPPAFVSGILCSATGLGREELVAWLDRCAATPMEMLLFGLNSHAEWELPLDRAPVLKFQEPVKMLVQHRLDAVGRRLAKPEEVKGYYWISEDGAEVQSILCPEKFEIPLDEKDTKIDAPFSMSAKLVMGKKAQTALKDVFIDEASEPFELVDAQWLIPETVNAMQVDAFTTPSPLR
eukprot:2291095-Amphidinium_carterae.1